MSNFYGNLEAVCESAGLAPLFGVMIDSQRVGAEKPDPAIFHARSRRAPRHARDDPLWSAIRLRRDCEGARRAGMGFIWIAPDDVQAAERRARSDRSAVAERGSPDFSIS